MSLPSACPSKLTGATIPGPRRRLGVYFTNLRVPGLGGTMSYQSTVGSGFNPRVISEACRSAPRPSTKTTLHGFHGVVKPGEMLVVLRSPGSGCTTLLKTLANQRDTFHSVEGDVHYHSLTPEEVAACHRGDVQYSPEDGVHFPDLAVEDTIRFAAGTRTPCTRAAGQSRDELVDEVTDLLTTVFGLCRVRKTLVGDAVICGVSGGEKRRVSICEATARRSLICRWDNSTRGLDSSTALGFVYALWIGTDTTKLTTIASIYQASGNVSFALQAVIVRSVFLRIPNTTSTIFSRGSAVYFAVLFVVLRQFAEIPSLFSRRPMVPCHQKAAMYHPFIEAAAATLMDILITVAAAAVYSVVLYLIVGLQASASQFSTFFLMVTTTSLTMKAFFRAIAAWFSVPSPAQSTALVNYELGHLWRVRT